MKQNFALTLSLMGVLLLLTACVKEKTDNEKLRPVGSEIIFSAATSYENDDRTRTVYTGKDENGQDVSTSSSIERIDWENDDRVSIVYATGSSQSEYKVTNVLSSNNENDLADVVATGTKLTWASGDNQVFYAMYPTANGNHANSAASLSGTTVSGTIPSSQSLGTSNNTQNHPKYLPDMKYAYMVGYANNTCINGSRVTIPFTPAVTAFNFIFKAASAVTVTGFEMTTTESGNVGTDLTGNFSFNISGPKMRNSRVVGAEWGTVTKTSPGKTITVNFGSDISLTANQYLDFTVFTLPIAQTGITIKFHLKNVTNGVTTNYTKTLDLKDGASTWHTFDAGKKHVVTNDKLAGDTITYTLDVTSSLSFAYTGESQTYYVTSYKQIGSNSNNRYPVEWTVTGYSTDGGSNWTTRPSHLTAFTTGATPPSASAQPYTATLAPIPRKCTTNSARTLGTKTEKGSESAPYDLSSGGTANCYVVDAPGWYCIPMTYGNGAYSFTGGTDSYFLPTFKNHLNADIDNAWVSNSSQFAVNGCSLVWQDSESLISNIGFHNFTSGSKSNGYIKFYVSPATINPGNAVIAAKSGNTIVWSWHIWVTDHSMTPVTVRGAKFMEVNLGWCDNETYTNEARTVKVRLRQMESGNTKEITLSQSGLSTPIQNYQTSPHYQWGRKDPFVPPTGIDPTTAKGTQNNEDTNKVWYNSAGTSSQVVPVGTSAVNLGTAIKNPMKFYYNSGAEWSSTSYCNLWDSGQKKNYEDATAGANSVVNQNPNGHGKTAYDPCPPGFLVPDVDDFKGFNSTTDLTAFTAHSSFYPIPTYSHGFTIQAGAASGSNTYQTSVNNFWPALGQRVKSTTSFLNLDKYGYFVSANTYKGTATLLIQFTDSWTAGNYNGGQQGIYMTQSSKSFARSVRCVKE